MKWSLFDEVSDGRVFTEFHENRLLDLRREVEALECTVELMRSMLTVFRGQSGSAIEMSARGLDN